MSKLPQLLLLPGLGADRRIAYVHESLPVKLVSADYIAARQSEDLASYSARFLEHLFASGQIDRGERLIVGGISLGGAIAQEISNLTPCEGVILIGSLRSSQELQPLVRFVGRHLAGHLPPLFYRAAAPLVPFVMSMLSGIPRADVRLSSQMFRDLSKAWFREGFRMIATWEGTEVRTPLLRIHGVQDHIISFRRATGVQFAIENAKHLVSLSHRRQVNEAIESWLRALYVW